MKQPTSLQIWQHPPAPHDRLIVVYGPTLYPTHKLAKYLGERWMDVDRGTMFNDDQILWWIEQDDYEGPPLNRQLREGSKPETMQ